MAAATVQERSGGRHVLGLGTGPATPGALERLRAEVASLRALPEDDPTRGPLLRLVHLTVSGVAAGLQNTG